MRRETVCIALLMALNFVVLGCGSLDPVTGRTSLGYVPARCYDFLDMIELNLGLDSEFSLYAMANVEPIALGGGVYECQKFGMDGRMLGQWLEKRFDVGLIIEAYVRYKKTANWGNRYLKDPFYSPHENVLKGDGTFYDDWGFSRKLYDHEHRMLDITAEANVFVIGADVGFSLMETFDFIVGLVGIDAISDDDWVDPYTNHDFPFSDANTEQERPVPQPIEEE